jgi:hypothetical protein
MGTHIIHNTVKNSFDKIFRGTHKINIMSQE